MLAKTQLGLTFENSSPSLFVYITAVLFFLFFVCLSSFLFSFLKSNYFQKCSGILLSSYYKILLRSMWTRPYYTIALIWRVSLPDAVNTGHVQLVYNSVHSLLCLEKICSISLTHSGKLNAHQNSD